MNVISYLISNKELSIIIIKVSHVLLFSLLWYLSYKLLDIIYIKIFKLNKQNLDNVLSSLNDKNILSFIVKLSYALSFFIALALTFKIFDLTINFLLKIEQISYAANQNECFANYQSIKLVANIIYYLVLCIVVLGVFILPLKLTKNTKYDLAKWLKADDKLGLIFKIRLITILFVIIFAPLFLYLDIKFIEPHLFTIFDFCRTLPY